MCVERSYHKEKYIIRTIDKPLEGIDRALVIAGSDKRGTIYGIYELSEQIGVSPWYWWADVPVVKQKNVYVRSNEPYIYLCHYNIVDVAVPIIIDGRYMGAIMAGTVKSK